MMCFKTWKPRGHLDINECTPVTWEWKSLRECIFVYLFTRKVSTLDEISRGQKARNVSRKSAKTIEIAPTKSKNVPSYACCNGENRQCKAERYT